MFRAFKHIVHPGIWGVFNEDGTISQCSTPYLHPVLATEDMVIKYWRGLGKEIDLSEWEFVIVELIVMK